VLLPIAQLLENQTVGHGNRQENIFLTV